MLIFIVIGIASLIGVRALRRRLVGGSEQPSDAFAVFARKARAEYFDPAIAMIGCAPLMPTAVFFAETPAKTTTLIVASIFAVALVCFGLLMIRRGWRHRDDLLWLQKHTLRGD